MHGTLACSGHVYLMAAMVNENAMQVSTQAKQYSVPVWLEAHPTVYAGDHALDKCVYVSVIVCVVCLCMCVCVCVCVVCVCV